MQFPHARLLIFAKAPLIGQVKTRLIPAIGAAVACDFYLQRLHATLALCCQSDLAPVELNVWPDAQTPSLHALAADYPITLQSQQGNDLGERMAHAVTRNIRAGRSPVVLLGVDAPSLTTQDMAQALSHLQQNADVVMSPAEDGGYVLLGLRDEQPALFTDMPWGTETVAEITKSRCQLHHLRLHTLSERWDIDRPEDLKRFYASQYHPAQE